MKQRNHTMSCQYYKYVQEVNERPAIEYSGMTAHIHYNLDQKKKGFMGYDKVVNGKTDLDLKSSDLVAHSVINIFLNVPYSDRGAD